MASMCDDLTTYVIWYCGYWQALFWVFREFSSLFLCGATREFVGYDTRVTYNGMREVLRNAARLVPPLKEINVIRVMAGLRPYTPDGLPLLGWVDGLEGFFMAAGHEGDGIALSPVTGKVVSELICDGTTFVDMTPFDPNRFALRTTDVKDGTGVKKALSLPVSVENVLY